MKKLFLHIGLPKTGTTALQNYFYQNQKLLEKKGILYPSTGRDVKKDYGPNHQELVNILFEKDHSKITSFFDRIDKEAEAALCKSIFISHEGMSNHFYDFNLFFCHVLQRLSRKFELNIIMGIRIIDNFFFSYYKQNILNPPINNTLGYGSSLTPSSFFKLRRVQLLLRYDNILSMIEKSCPTARKYLVSNDDYKIVEKLTKFLGVYTPGYSILKNQSLSDYKVDIVRCNNEALRLKDPSVRVDFINNIRSIDKEEPLFSFRNNAILNEKLKKLNNQLNFSKDVILLN